MTSSGAGSASICSTPPTARACVRCTRSAAMRHHKSPPECNSLLHRALIVESVLAVFNNRGDRFEHIRIPILHRFLQVEVLNRDMIIAEPKLAAHRVEVEIGR